MINELKYGIEIETIGASRAAVAKAIQSVVGGKYRYIGTPYCYDPHEVKALDGRCWKVTADSSLQAPKNKQAEIVSPILTWNDLETLQKIVRAVRKTGAKPHSSAGIHIHVDGAAFTPKAVSNLLKFYNKQEELFMHALGIHQNRRDRWCKGIDQERLARIEKCKPKTMDELRTAWYGYNNRNPGRYDSSRYHAVNINSLFNIGTIEFRAQNSTLHAGKIKTYVQFALALSHKAITAKAASSKKRDFNPATAKYDMRVITIRLKMIGEVFKTARYHLTKNLEGSASWKNGRP